MQTNKILFFLLLILPTSTLLSQKRVEVPDLVNNIVYEKVYLHIDREVYAPREDIWFKVYLVSGISNRLIQGYKNVYVQLVDQSGKVCDDRLILVINGEATGDFDLPYDIEEGRYTLRAFTEYQKNFGEESYFHKRIWISAMKIQQADQEDQNIRAIDVNFFPESGNLVLNAANNIAFKAINSKGYGIQISGYILNDLNDTITPFSSRYLGMGSFALMPTEGRSYRAVINNYPAFTYKFSDIQADGIALQYKDEGSSVKFGLVRNFVKTKEETFRLQASHKGIRLFEEEIQLESFYSELNIPKGRFPLGISKITLLDPDGVIKAERLVFIKVDEAPLIEIQPGQLSYSKRSKVNLDLNLYLPEDDSVVSGVSVSVINRDYLTRDGYVTDIRSYLLLDSELKGKIEASATYFTDEGGLSSGEKLDLLMLVQGWRSYYWPDIVSREPERLIGWQDIGIRVKGHVKKLLRDKPVVDGKVIVGPISSAFTFVDTYTDENGEYQFDRLFLRDSSTLIVQGKSMNGNDRTEVYIDEIYRPEQWIDPDTIDLTIQDPIVPDSYFGESYKKLEAERKYAMESGTYWLEEVEVVDKRKELILDLTEEAERSYGKPQRRFVITDEDMTSQNLIDYLEAKIPQMEVSGDQISIRGGGTPAILLDDVINDLVDIRYIPMGDIDHIDIFYTGAQLALFGSRGANGVIAIYTKMGSVDYDFVRYVKGRATAVVDGFQKPRQFYSPKYTIENINTDLPDYRATLYWNPYVKFEKGQAKINFFSSDFLSKYVVLVEGISKKGVICTGMGAFEVGN